MVAEQEPEEWGRQRRQDPGGDLQRQNREIEPGEGYRANSGVNLLEERDHQRRQLGGELRELDRKIEATEGHRLLTKMGLLEKSYYVFDGNYLSLKHILEEFEQPTVFVRLWEERHHDRLDLFLNDTLRSFHNYLAGAKTLLEHTRVLKDDLYGVTPFAEEYRAQREEKIKGTPLIPFVEDLFSFMLLEEIPFALAELSLGGVGDGIEVDSAVKLEVSKLREWKQWSDEGREYLAGLDDKVKLGDIIDEHKSIVAEFYRWFATRQSDLHGEALEVLNGLKSERENLRQKIERQEDLLETVEKTAITIQEEREQLARELEEQKRYREWDKARADEVEAELEYERNKGFWSRLFRR